MRRTEDVCLLPVEALRTWLRHMCNSFSVLQDKEQRVKHSEMRANTPDSCAYSSTTPSQLPPFTETLDKTLGDSSGLVTACRGRTDPQS